MFNEDVLLDKVNPMLWSLTHSARRVWRWQRGNQYQLIKEGQTTPLQKGTKRQNNYLQNTIQKNIKSSNTNPTNSDAPEGKAFHPSL